LLAAAAAAAAVAAAGMLLHPLLDADLLCFLPSCSSSVQGTVAGAEASAAAAKPRRPVVTAFVRRDDGKLLVVKRSDKVNTHTRAGPACMIDRQQEVTAQLLALYCCL
jgi:hypothetical protein